MSDAAVLDAGAARSDGGADILDIHDLAVHFRSGGRQVDALRGLLIGTPANLGLDFGVLVGASAIAIGVASALLGRLAR